MKGRPTPLLVWRKSTQEPWEKKKKEKKTHYHGYKHTTEDGYLFHSQPRQTAVGFIDLIHALTCLLTRGCTETHVSCTSGARMMLPTVLVATCGCFSPHGCGRRLARCESESLDSVVIISFHGSDPLSHHLQACFNERIWLSGWRCTALNVRHILGTGRYRMSVFI